MKVRRQKDPAIILGGNDGAGARCSTLLYDFHPFFYLLKPPAPLSLASLSAAYVIKL